MLRRVLACLLVIMATAACTESGGASDGGSRFILSADYPLPVVESDQPELPATVTDASDTSVTVSDASRIVVLNQAVAEIVISLGMKENIIGRDATTTLEALQAVEKVSNGHDEIGRAHV